VNNLTRKKPGQPEANPDAERRKVGMVVHDDRGNASVSWRDAPADYERPVLEVLGDPGLSIQSDQTYDPYAHRPVRGADGNASAATSSPGRGGTRPGSGTGTRPTTRTDLRRLSDWIKMMRELEQRKREDGGGESSG
jgi:hypothetical protein